LLEISQHVFRKRIVKVIRNDEGAGGKTEWSGPMHVVDWADLGDRAIVLHENERFTFEDPMEHSLRISLYVFHADVRHRASLANSTQDAEGRTRRSK
jgi:hypothetical protein